MSAEVQFIPPYNLKFKKGFWTDDDIMTATCLNFIADSKEGSYLCDVRITAPDSIMYFLNTAFPHFMMSANMKWKRETLFKNLNNCHNKIFRHFADNLYPRLQYPKHLYKHQAESLSLMVHRKYNLLSFEQGLGKTITSASITQMLNLNRTVIVCPALVKWNWYHDLSDSWAFDRLTFTILDSKKSKSIRAFDERFLIVNYEIIEKYWQYIVKDKIDHIIVDECHYAKNHKTKRFKNLSKLVKHADCRVTLLSGTPITNRVNDLFAYCKLIGHPLGKNHNAFMQEYTVRSGVRGGRVIGAKNIDILRGRMSNFMIRKKTEECLDLPKLIINNCYFDMDELREEYDQTLETLHKNRQEYENAKSEQQKAMIGGKARMNIHSLNRIVATSKAKKIKELIDSLWEQERKAIVFAGYKSALTELENIYQGNCVKIDGSVDSHKRQQLIDRFINDPKCHVFLGNFKAAGVGINLVNACDVIFMNFPFTPDDIEQPYKRAHRIGQKKNVNVHYTMARGTIDEYIYNMLIDKSNDINELVDHGKQGVIDYSNVPSMLFNKLVNAYRKERGINEEVKEEFISIK